MGPFDVSGAGPLSAALSALAQAAQALAAAVQALHTPPGSDPALSDPPPSGPDPSCMSNPWPTPLTYSPNLEAPALVHAVNEFLLSKARSGRSDRYLRQLRVSLRSFVGGRSTARLEALGPGDVERWLSRSRWSPRTRIGYLSDLRTFFAWCQRRGWCQGNPAAAVDTPAAVPSRPGIINPDTARDILAHAVQVDIGAARVLALRLFGGLRTAESLRLEESDIGERHVKVEASKSKTRSRRLVPITPALRAFLDLPGGPLPVSEKRIRRTLARFAGKLPSNWARHSFVSYRLADIQNAHQVALEAGHAEAVLFRSYRELVPPPQAQQFWSLRPESPGGPV